MKTAAKLSRSGRTNPLGKCDAELKTKLDLTTREEINADAADVGLPTSEYMRISIHLWKGQKELLLASYENLLTAIERKWKESAPIHKHHRPLAVTKKTTKVLHLRRAA